MAITVKCPNPSCGKFFNLKDDLAGKTVKWTVVAILGKAILDYVLIRWFNI